MVFSRHFYCPWRLHFFLKIAAPYKVSVLGFRKAATVQTQMLLKNPKYCNAICSPREALGLFEPFPAVFFGRPGLGLRAEGGASCCQFISCARVPIGWRID
jgi:hypothetical protein